MFHHRLILADRCIHCESDASGFAPLFVDNHASIVPMRKKQYQKMVQRKSCSLGLAALHERKQMSCTIVPKALQNFSHNESGAAAAEQVNTTARAARYVLNGSSTVSYRHWDGCSRLSRAAPPAAISFFLSSHLSRHPPPHLPWKNY